MGFSYTDIPDYELEKIRNEFNQKYKVNIDKGNYHSADLERISDGTDWIRAMFKHSQENFDKTVNNIHEVLTWRKEFDANNLITSTKFPFSEELLKRGGMFVRNEDIHCIPLLHFITKLHKKDQYPHEQICKFIAFFFERAYKFNIDDPIVLLFDMSDAGYSNLDMDMIKFVVNCLKTYYPGLIDYMIIYQMPFIFNAAWKIIKNWLPPESVKLIKFLDKKSIKEFIHETQLFIHMGGTDNYKYVYDPKAYLPAKKQLVKQQPVVMKTKEDIMLNLDDTKNNKKIIIEKLDVESSSEQNSREISNNNSNNDKQQENKQDNLFVNSVTSVSIERNQSFTSTIQPSALDDNNKEITNTDQITQSKTSTLNNNNSMTNNSSTVVKRVRSSIASKLNDMSRASELNMDASLTTPLLIINPGEELIFQLSDQKPVDICQTIQLTNTSESNLAYKIKITSPDKFRVKPGTGIIEKSSSVQIMINYLKEFHSSNTGNRDKFLILWTPINEKLASSELNEFWKQAIQQKSNVHEHKVKCILVRSNDTNKPVTPLPSSPQFTTTSNQNIQAATHVETNNKENNLVMNSKAYKKLIDPLSNEVVNKHENQNNIYIKLNENNNTHQNTGFNDQRIIISRLNSIESNVNNIIDNQQKLSKQYSIILFLCYFLILLNLIQILFQSNLFSNYIEPQLDYLLFHQKKNADIGID